MNNELKKIKKIYGEEMMKFCRSNFGVLLEKENILLNFLTQMFYPNRQLIRDIKAQNLDEEFILYVLDNLDQNKKTVEELKASVPVPEVLLDQAGYDLFHCKTQKEIESFKKYYAKGEQLCTFKQTRLKNYHVFFAVKKDVAAIKRKDFENPKREDKYGTSVMSFQMSRKNTSILSIKNRYNHTVSNPDATYNNDLNKIAPGLRDSFKYHYNFFEEKKYEFRLENYVLTSENKFLKYNCEFNNIYFGINNSVSTANKYFNLEKEKYLIFDDCILDLKNKVFLNSIEDELHGYDLKIGKIENLSIVNEGELKVLTIQTKNDEYPIIIKIDKQNRIVEYEDNNLVNVPSGFLSNSRALKKIKLGRAEVIGDRFANKARELEEVYAPNLKYAGDDFASKAKFVNDLYFPQLKRVGRKFFNNANVSGKVNLNSLEYISDGCLSNDTLISALNIDNVSYIGDSFLQKNAVMKDFSAKSVEIIGDYFLHSNLQIDRISFKKLKITGSYFLNNNQIITMADMPSLTRVENCFMTNNQSLKQINFKILEKVGSSFLSNNEIIEKVDFSNLIYAGGHFMNSNLNLKSAKFPRLEKVGNFFLTANQIIDDIDFSKLDKAGLDFLASNLALKEAIFPELIRADASFLSSNKTVKYLYFPKLEELSRYFMEENIDARFIIFPEVTKVSEGAFRNNKAAKVISFPKAITIDKGVLMQNDIAKLVYIPKDCKVSKSFIPNSEECKIIKETGKKIS